MQTTTSSTAKRASSLPPRRRSIHRAGMVRPNGDVDFFYLRSPKQNVRQFARLPVRVIVAESNQCPEWLGRFLRSRRSNAANLGTDNHVPFTEKSLSAACEGVGIATGTQERVDDQTRGQIYVGQVIDRHQ